MGAACGILGNTDNEDGLTTFFTDMRPLPRYWKEIVEYCPNERENFWEALKLEQLQNHFEFEGDINAQNKEGETPLHHAVRYSENAEIIKELCNAKAGIHAKNRYGQTPLHVAAYSNKSIEVIKELHNAGADVNAKDINSKKPYDLLLYNKALKDNEEAIKLLKPKP